MRILSTAQVSFILIIKSLKIEKEGKKRDGRPQTPLGPAETAEVSEKLRTFLGRYMTIFSPRALLLSNCSSIFLENLRIPDRELHKNEKSSSVS